MLLNFLKIANWANFVLKTKQNKNQGKLQDNLTFKHRQNLGKTLANVI